jgi:hypothetical protein
MRQPDHQDLVFPPGHAGPYHLPDGRHVWWTGRVAIGLRYERRERADLGRNALWLQALLSLPQRRVATARPGSSRPLRPRLLNAAG